MHNSNARVDCRTWARESHIRQQQKYNKNTHTRIRNVCDGCARARAGFRRSRETCAMHGTGFTGREDPQDVRAATFTQQLAHVCLRITCIGLTSPDTRGSAWQHALHFLILNFIAQHRSADIRSANASVCLPSTRTAHRISHPTHTHALHRLHIRAETERDRESV